MYKVTILESSLLNFIKEFISIPPLLNDALDRPFVRKILKSDHLHVLNNLYMRQIEEQKEKIKVYQRFLDSLGPDEIDSDLQEMIIVKIVCFFCLIVMFRKLFILVNSLLNRFQRFVHCVLKLLYLMFMCINV
jgi:hypothetical protein